MRLNEQGLLESTCDTHEPLFSTRQVGVAAFLGGPLGGSWLMYKNFFALGNKPQCRLALWGSVLLTMALAVIVLWLPTDFPNPIIPAVTVAGFGGWFYLTLDADFQVHQENDGPQGSWWAAVGLGVVSLIATLLLVTAIALAVPILPVNHVQHGPSIVYYEGDATRENAEHLGDFLADLGVFRHDTAWEVTLEFPRRDSRIAVLKIPYYDDIEGTSAHRELQELAAFLDEEMYAVKDLEIHVQSALGFTQSVIRND